MENLELKAASQTLVWPEVIYDLQERLSDLGIPVYIVGGAVRDAYLRRPIVDIDLVVPQDAIRIARVIANRFRGDIFVMDRERDVARAIVEGPAGIVRIDVARYRGDSLLSDLRDRDFRINAIAVPLRSDLTEIFDPLDGEGDLRQKMIRMCNPDSLKQDSIRALRAIRQSAQLSFRMDRECIEAIREVKEQIYDSSPERVRDELFKIFALKDNPIALRVAYQLGLLGVVLPEVDGLDQVIFSDRDSTSVWEHSLLAVVYLKKLVDVISPSRTDNTGASFVTGMFAMQMDRYRGQLQDYLGQKLSEERSTLSVLGFTALLHYVAKTEKLSMEMDIQRTLEKVLNRMDALRLSNEEKRFAGEVIRHYQTILTVEDWNDLNLHRFWYQTDAYGVAACLLGLVDYLASFDREFNQDRWLILVERVRILLDAYYFRYEEVVRPQMVVNGNDLMARLDLSQGPVLGELLTIVREGQVMGEVKTPEDAYAVAMRYLARD